MVVSSLDGYFDMSVGGNVSSDVGIICSDIRIDNGNYIQTTDFSKVKNYSEKNTFMQVEEATGYGDSCAGSNAFCIIGVISALNQIKLSGDITILKEIMDGTKTFGDLCPNSSSSRSVKRVIGLDIQDNSKISSDYILSGSKFSISLGNSSASMAYRISAINEDENIITLIEPLS